MGVAAPPLIPAFHGEPWILRVVPARNNASARE